MRLLREMERVWRSGDFTGDQRPTARVTIQRPKMALHQYSLTSYLVREIITWSGTPTTATTTTVKTRKVSQTYANFLWGATTKPVELPNIKSVQWTRSLSQDAASVRIEMYNNVPTPVPSTPPAKAPKFTPGIDAQGYYSPYFGARRYAVQRWNQVPNQFRMLLLPDSLVRTYEGYGNDLAKAPEADTHLAQTGTWMVDSVQLSAFGTIVITGRDLARLLLDHSTMVPVVPNDFDPLAFQNWDDQNKPAVSASELALRCTAHSVQPWAISNVVNGQPGRVADPENYRGHRAVDALDPKYETYWLSIGNSSARKRWSYEWFQVGMNASTIGSVRVHMVGKGYTCYVSVKVNGAWVNDKGIINYHEDGVGRNGSAIPYVHSFPVKTTKPVEVKLPKVYAGVTEVRVTFNNLQYFREFGDYRAGLRHLRVFSAGSKAVTFTKKPPAGANPGRFNDYTDMVKLACAWAGLFWPKGAKDTWSDGTVHPRTFPAPDAVLAVNGRVWGDFEDTGEAGKVPVPSDDLANKTLMDVVSYVRDNHGYVFYCDETGAAQWRLPNFYAPGNWITDYSVEVGRTRSIREIDEKQVLLDLDASFDSTSLREIIMVGSAAGQFTAVRPGYNPNDVGLRRILLWNNSNWASKEEAVTAADMIAVRMMFTYRTDSVTIPAFPGIQIDDQVRVFEATTASGYVHYINGISSNHDCENGDWTYELQTHWLGDDPDSGNWAALRSRAITDRARGVIHAIRRPR